MKCGGCWLQSTSSGRFLFQFIHDLSGNAVKVGLSSRRDTTSTGFKNWSTHTLVILLKRTRTHITHYSNTVNARKSNDNLETVFKGIPHKLGYSYNVCCNQLAHTNVIVAAEKQNVLYPSGCSSKTLMPPRDFMQWRATEPDPSMCRLGSEIKKKILMRLETCFKIYCTENGVNTSSLCQDNVDFVALTCSTIMCSSVNLLDGTNANTGAQVDVTGNGGWNQKFRAIRTMTQSKISCATITCHLYIDNFNSTHTKIWRLVIAHCRRLEYDSENHWSFFAQLYHNGCSTSPVRTARAPYGYPSSQCPPILAQKAAIVHSYIGKRLNSIHRKWTTSRRPQQACSHSRSLRLDHIVSYLAILLQKFGVSSDQLIGWHVFDGGTAHLNQHKDTALIWCSTRILSGYCATAHDPLHSNHDSDRDSKSIEQAHASWAIQEGVYMNKLIEEFLETAKCLLPHIGARKSASQGFSFKFTRIFWSIEEHGDTDARKKYVSHTNLGS